MLILNESHIPAIECSLAATGFRLRVIVELQQRAEHNQLNRVAKKSETQQIWLWKRHCLACYFCSKCAYYICLSCGTAGTVSTFAAACGILLCFVFIYNGKRSNSILIIIIIISRDNSIFMEKANQIIKCKTKKQKTTYSPDVPSVVDWPFFSSGNSNTHRNFESISSSGFTSFHCWQIENDF